MADDDDRTVYKSAVTGEFVSKEYAEANPDTTYATTVEDADEIEVDEVVDSPEPQQMDPSTNRSDGTASKGRWQ